jgi:isoleucyl-tRNA synthetase
MDRMKNKMALSPTPNLVEIEKEMAKRWEKQGLLKKYLEKNKDSKKKWSFLDGPITANLIVRVYG